MVVFERPLSEAIFGNRSTVPKCFASKETCKSTIMAIIILETYLRKVSIIATASPVGAVRHTRWRIGGLLVAEPNTV
jgi:hypothetical protein